MTTGHLFLLGGRDLEMVEVGRLVRDALGEEALRDQALPWHDANASAYAEDIATALRCGQTPVLIELRPDLPGAILDHCVVVDHHGKRAGTERPTSLEQVFELLRLPRSRWTRRLALVAANDRGWVPGLRAIGARPAEIAAIRAEDRAAQGITKSDEEAGRIALANRVVCLDGTLVRVKLPHDRTAVVFDRLAVEAGEGDPPDTLVIGPQELNFSGRGRRVLELAAAFPAGWSGGDLPARGFWGHAAPLPELADVLRTIARA
jgi:hypothetical protein